MIGSPRVAIVGGGMAGLACARTLARAGFEVHVLDKGRGPGGRVSTRRTHSGDFDHGAQYFTVRNSSFAREVETWLAEGVVAEWRGRFVAISNPGGRMEPVQGATRRLVGVPGMSAIGRHLARDLNYHPRERVLTLRQSGGMWSLQTASRKLGPFSHVVLAMPPAQVLELAPEFGDDLAPVAMTPCWSLLLTIPEPVPLEFDGAFLEGSALSWAARNRSKPGRGSPETWVIHAGPEWSVAHLEWSSEDVATALLDAARTELGLVPPGIVNVGTHRWRYAQPREPLPETFLMKPDRNLSAAGDWCGGPRVEGAYRSGLALGRELLRAVGS